MAVRRIDRRMPGDEVAGPGLVEGVEMLLDQEVRHAGGELQADGGGDRAAALVRRDVAAVGERRGRPPQRVGDAAERHRLGLEDVDAAALGERVELADGVVHLAGRDRDRAARGRPRAPSPGGRASSAPPTSRCRVGASRCAAWIAAISVKRAWTSIRMQRVGRQAVAERAAGCRRRARAPRA